MENAIYIWTLSGWVLGAEVVPGLEGEFCNIRESTANMGIRRMTNLIEYSTAWAVGNGVRLREVLTKPECGAEPKARRRNKE
ncbi:hypothetical protein ETR_17297 [Erwinia tracheiphila PSU-1]|nr:hypothetical protein ETR_17297 [Erwinia tracheiphila PSU-1]